MGPYPMELTRMENHNAFTGCIYGPNGRVGRFIIGSPTDLWFEAAYQYGKMLPRLAVRFTFNGWR